MDTSPGLRVDLSVIALLALILAPAEVSAAEGDEELRALLRGEVPWAVEAPGAAGARFGLGLEVFFERQESLRITSLEETIRARDLLLGQEEGGTTRGDPDLLNRKFDYLFEMKGAGFQLPIALPNLGLPGVLKLYSTLVVQAATADVTFDFLDRTRSQDSTTFEGRGPLFGAGLELTTALCRSCPWFTGASYHFQKLPSLDVERSPAFAPEGFEVQRDESRLSRDVHETSARVGYGFPGGRAVAYLGARFRSTDLEIEDDLRYLDPFREVETTLTSQTQLESEATLALAGVEAHLGGPFYGRIETAVSDEDYVALFNIVYLRPGEGSSSTLWRRGAESEQERRKREQRAAEIASRIAPQLEAIEAAFLADWQGLDVVEGPDGQPAYIAQDVEDRLRKVEDQILAVLKQFPELEALWDWVEDKFQTIRIDLRSENPVSVTRRPPQVTLAAFGSTSLQQTQPKNKTNNRGRADATRDNIVQRHPLGTLKGRMLNGKIQIQFAFQTPIRGKTGLRIHPRYNEDPNGPCYHTLGPEDPIWVYIGSYSFKVLQENVRRGKPLPSCNANRPDSLVRCPLDLVENPCATFWCDEDRCKCL